jgi:hypothetical protein
MTQTNTPDSHMPPQPGETDAPQNPVYSGPRFNPDTNEWAPSNEQEAVWGLAEPSHGDQPEADPVSESYGQAPSGTVPDTRLNLIDSIRARTPLAAPVVEHHHVVETQELASSKLRLRLVAVVGNNAPTVILEENPARDRALIHIFTAGSTILLTPLRQGGAPVLVAAPTLPGAFWPLQTNDGTLEIKAQAGMEAVGVSAAGVVLVSVLEEMKDTNPGVGL